MAPFIDSTKLPENPVKRLETFGVLLFGYFWKTALASAMGEHKRTMSYWISGHTPPDLDERLKVLATEMIADQHRRAATLKDLRDQLEETV
jgi:hypothetical protein